LASPGFWQKEPRAGMNGVIDARRFSIRTKTKSEPKFAF
jgi:hypothetical protein